MGHLLFTAFEWAGSMGLKFKDPWICPVQGNGGIYFVRTWGFFVGTWLNSHKIWLRPLSEHHLFLEFPSFSSSIVNIPRFQLVGDRLLGWQWHHHLDQEKPTRSKHCCHSRPGSPLVGIYSVLEDGTPLDTNGGAWNVIDVFPSGPRADPKEDSKKAVENLWNLVCTLWKLIDKSISANMCVNLKSPSFISDSRGRKMDAVFQRARMTIPHITMLTMEFLTQRLHHCISSKIYQGLRWMFLFGVICYTSPD